MNYIIKLSGIFLALAFFMLTACKKDDPVTPAVFTVNNLITTTDENPANGQVLGTIQVQNSTGNLSFTFNTQSPTGAMSLNPSTGQLTVADASKFDFETNPVITATVNVIDAQNNATAEVSINLNDVEAVADALSTSRSAYDAAPLGSWVLITESEYENLALLNEITRSGTSETEYNDPSTTSSTFAGFTVANRLGADMPVNSYLIAFKYHNLTDNAMGNKVKVSSTSISSGYGTVGNPLPVNGIGDQYFVFKGVGIQTTGTGYLAMFENNSMGFKSVPGTGTQEDLGDVDNLTNEINGYYLLFQGLSTTQIQW